MINNVDDLIAAYKRLDNHPLIDQMTDKEINLSVVRSTSASFLHCAEDDKLVDMVSEMEHSSGYYIYDDNGSLDKRVVSKLGKEGIEIVRLGEDYLPFTHGIKAKKFHVLISY